MEAITSGLASRRDADGISTGIRWCRSCLALRNSNFITSRMAWHGVYCAHHQTQTRRFQHRIVVMIGQGRLNSLTKQVVSLRGVGSRQNRFHHLPMHIGQPEIAARVAEGELFVVKPEAVKDGRLDIVNVDRIFHDVEAEVVRGSISHA